MHPAFSPICSALEFLFLNKLCISKCLTLTWSTSPRLLPICYLHTVFMLLSFYQPGPSGKKKDSSVSRNGPLSQLFWRVLKNSSSVWKWHKFCKPDWDAQKDALSNANTSLTSCNGCSTLAEGEHSSELYSWLTCARSIAYLTCCNQLLHSLLSSDSNHNRRTLAHQKAP